MSDLAAFTAKYAPKKVFYDQHEARTYKRAVALAMRLLVEPGLIKNGLNFLETHVKGDPHQARAYNTWKALLREAPEDIVRLFLGDTPQGDELRSSAPVFFTLTPSAARELWTTTP